MIYLVYKNFVIVYKLLSQQMVKLELLKAFNNSRNIALSGPGGVGKTYQINQLKEYCEKENINMSLCASTGIAANLIGGTTLHHWAGIKPFFVDKFREGNFIFYPSEKKESTKRIRKTKVLVIDEVSMLGKYTFDLVDHICRLVKKNNKPFGGIQVIISFDMLQLPPVKDEYIFKSAVWDELNFFIIYLTESFRTDDSIFFNLLSRARIGTINNDDKKILQSRLNGTNEEFEKQGIKPTVLYSHKVDVDKLNFDNLKNLPGPYYNYKSIDVVDTKTFGIITNNNINNLTSEEKKKAKDMFEYIDTIVQKELYLKVGAQVLLTINKSVEKGLVNGSRGVVTSCQKEGVTVNFQNESVFIDYTSFEHEDECKTIYIRRYLPLQLAWSLTIHKIQGQTLEYAMLDLGKSIFCAGQAYVALSRMKSLEGTIISSLDTSKFYACKEAIEFDSKIKSQVI